MRVSHKSYCFIQNALSIYKFFLLLDVSQLTIAKMDKFLLLQISEGNLQLTFNYMGTYPSDKVPQLTESYFTIINSALSNDRGKHWLMIARLDKITTLLILWVEKEQPILF